MRFPVSWVVEVGGATTRPVHDVMRLAPAGWTVAAGRLAVAVAHDERLPHRRRDRAGGTADVEDFGAACSDDAAHVAVAGESFERDRRQPTHIAALGAELGDQLRSRAW